MKKFYFTILMFLLTRLYLFAGGITVPIDTYEPEEIILTDDRIRSTIASDNESVLNNFGTTGFCVETIKTNSII